MSRTVLVFFALAVCLRGQVAGTINGFVKDPTGAIVPGAVVTAIMTGQQLTRTALADNTGFFNMLSMQPGAYEISAAAPGFDKQLQSGVRLTSGEILRLDVTLKVGAVQTEIAITGTATLVNTTNSTLSGLVDDRRVQDLPLNGRNVVALARILPGITNVSAPQEVTNTRGGPDMSVNGGRSVNNNFTFNGANFTHFGQTTGVNMPPPDAVQEIRIQTNNFTSEYGNNSGSQVSVTSKAGTNQLHGSLWEFLRNDKLNARSEFQTRRAQTRQNQFGGAGGGRSGATKSSGLATTSAWRTGLRRGPRKPICRQPPSAQAISRGLPRSGIRMIPSPISPCWTAQAAPVSLAILSVPAASARCRRRFSNNMFR